MYIYIYIYVCVWGIFYNVVIIKCVSKYICDIYFFISKTIYIWRCIFQKFHVLIWKRFYFQIVRFDWKRVFLYLKSEILNKKEKI